MKRFRWLGKHGLRRPVDVVREAEAVAAEAEARLEFPPAAIYYRIVFNVTNTTDTTNTFEAFRP